MYSIFIFVYVCKVSVHLRECQHTKLLGFSLKLILSLKN